MKTIGFLCWGSAAVLALAFAEPAQAWNNWSVGIGFGGPGYGYRGGYGCRPWGYGGYYRPYPLYIAPPPVVVAPSPYVVQPAPVIVQQQPTVVQQQPTYVTPQAPAITPSPETAPAPQRLQSDAQPQPISTTPDLTPVATSAKGNPQRQQTIAYYLRCLADPNEGVRLDAVTRLGQMKAYRAIDPLAATLAGDRSSTVREAAARSLGLMRNPKALPALQRAAQVDADHDVRRTAQFSIEIIQTR